MLAGFVYMATGLFCLPFVLWGNLLTVSEKNKEYLLFMTIREEQRREKEVQEIVRGYQRAVAKFMVLCVALSVLFLFCGNYASLAVFYLTAWLTFVILGDYRLNKKYANKMYALKREKGWSSPGKTVVRGVDTKVSRLKKTMPVSALWLVIPVWISIGSLLWWLMAGTAQKGFVILPLMNILATVFFCLMYHQIVHGKLKVYCDDSEVNYAMNRMYKRTWSGCIVFLTILQAAVSLLMMLQLSGYMKRIAAGWETTGGIVWAVFIETAVVVALVTGAVLLAGRKISKMKKELFTATDAGEEITEDEDFYWKNGYYYNPNDTNGLVENREGFGLTANMAGMWGGVMKWALLLTLLLCIGISIGLLPLDFGKITLKTGQNAIELKGCFYYKKTIRFAEVSEVILLDECPKARRIWGSGMKRVALGNYHFEGYGSGTAMITRDAKKFLMVKENSGKWTCFSVEDEGEMQEAYELLKGARNIN